MENNYVSGCNSLRNHNIVSLSLLLRSTCLIKIIFFLKKLWEWYLHDMQKCKCCWVFAVSVWHALRRRTDYCSSSNQLFRVCVVVNFFHTKTRDNNFYEAFINNHASGLVVKTNLHHTNLLRKIITYKDWKCQFSGIQWKKKKEKPLPMSVVTQPA